MKQHMLYEMLRLTAAIGGAGCIGYCFHVAFRSPKVTAWTLGIAFVLFVGYVMLTPSK